MPSSETRSALALAATLAAAGTLHFAQPKPFDRIVPRALPGTPRTWTYASGVAELTCAAAVAHPRTRSTGALAAAALFVAVFPANVQMAVDTRRSRPALRYGSLARLPLQLPLIRWAWRVRSANQR
ncbi:hypothetical protein GIY23_04695 [Allosaccharopolyspora coralli]|uniref:DoxX family protein n=1 Tax=Allosaccharopolyspora coralli TaxID=2665642 RepID=A0A5Q3QBE4_9PSEU|nr:DoxX family protein [Allosaccharopolyspora coralli]QGK68929.1 hypothetical protein GIY23_04695 [Allosaccharopolyspora coralli]